MSIDQRITVSKLESEGFTVTSGKDGVIAVRGSDYRIIHQDGSQHRATGARR